MLPTVTFRSKNKETHLEKCTIFSVSIAHLLSDLKEKQTIAQDVVHSIM